MNTYNIKDIKVLSKIEYIEEKIKRDLETIKKFGFTPKEEAMKEVARNYEKQYMDLLNNKYDIGYLIPDYVKVKQVVLYQNDFCFIDDKNKLYYIAD